jgi:hypothetical protein
LPSAISRSSPASAYETTYFGSKAGLFVAVVQEADRRQRQLLASSFGAKEP